MRVWITKYALAKGVYEVDGSISDATGSFIVEGARSGCAQFFHKNEWHPTKARALEHAKKMRLAKISSLQKQIAKLKALKF